MNMKWMSITIWGNTLKTYLIALAIVVAVMVVLLLVRRVMIRYFSRKAQESDHDGYDFMLAVAQRTLFPLMLVVSLYAGKSLLAVHPGIELWLTSAAVAAVVLQATLWANALVTFWLNRYQKQNRNLDPSRVTTMRAVTLAARLLLIVIAIILILDNIPGVQITALMASLGIGGVAIALAIQNILSDLFASLSIILDKPFVLGDFIIVDSYMGSVEYIGLKTTRIRSLSGEELVFANNDLLKSRIRNYKRMAERRVVFGLGVTYQTPFAQLKAIAGWIEAIISEMGMVRFDRAHFQTFGDAALRFEVVYYMLDPDYNRFMDTQQAINLAIHQKFEAEGVAFAYPTQTIHLAGDRRNSPAAAVEESNPVAEASERAALNA
jgi:small-conductance mechanosensitive channel